MIQSAIVANFGGFTHHHTHTVVDEHPMADSRTRMNLDTRDPAREMRNKTC